MTSSAPKNDKQAERLYVPVRLLGQKTDPKTKKTETMTFFGETYHVGAAMILTKYVPVGSPYYDAFIAVSDIKDSNFGAKQKGFIKLMHNYRENVLGLEEVSNKAESKVSLADLTTGIIAPAFGVPPIVSEEETKVNNEEEKDNSNNAKDEEEKDNSDNAKRGVAEHTNGKARLSRQSLRDAFLRLEVAFNKDEYTVGYQQLCKELLISYLDGKKIDRINPKAIIWCRQVNGEKRNTTTEFISQIIDCLNEANVKQIIFVGDKMTIPNGDNSQEFFDIRNFHGEVEFKNLASNNQSTINKALKIDNSMVWQLLTYDILFEFFQVMVSIGMKSGALDGPAMIGLDTIFFDNCDSPRMLAFEKINRIHRIRYNENDYDSSLKWTKKSMPNAVLETLRQKIKLIQENRKVRDKKSKNANKNSKNN